ncbi:MAG: Arginine-tRNA-protein transferase [Labilithrix sp.]|nr:Arginine-tRNA-protein transferase [Labilithrix sp.]
MAKLLQQLVEAPRACSYLEQEVAQLEIRVMLEVTTRELEALLERGWRRFGPMYFRPACAACSECVTLRVDAAAFKPSKSQRRAAKNARRLRRIVSVPVVDDERLALYAKWHAQREDRKGWEPTEVDPERYAMDFAFPHPAAREVAFRDPEDGDRLVGLGIVDETPNALSAVYFYWDPEHAPSSLGVANVVTLVEDAQARGIPHVYLGYRVMGCPSLLYKSRFGPHELLEGRPGFGESGVWRREVVGEEGA